MAYDFSKHSKEELLAEYSRVKQAGNQPLQQQAQPKVSQQHQSRGLIMDALEKFSPGLSRNIEGFASGAAQQYGGQGLPQNDLAKLYAQESIKKQFEDPIDKELQRDYKRAATERALRDPFYMTPEGQQYYGAGAFQREQQGKQAAAETGLMNQVMPAVEEAMQGNQGQLPPGASISAGPVTFQPNPRLTDTEQAAVAGSQALEPVVGRIIQEVRGGIYGKGNDVERTARQGIVDSGNAILSSQDTRLQSFQSDINNLKRLIPFTDGGKQLTPFEAKRVFALLNTAGKNDQQIESDISAAVSIVMAKGGLAIGGRNAALQGSSQSPQANRTSSGNTFRKVTQ